MLKVLALLGPLMATTAYTAEYFPQNLLKLDDLFSHHVILAEKSTHRLLLYQNQNGLPQLIHSYPMATGTKKGDKTTDGDRKTPEGLYEITEFLPHRELMARYGPEGRIYGVGGFVMNYPNPMDRLEKKSGSGIWLHSTNEEARINLRLESRGCLVISNKNLIELAQYIELHSSHIIVVDRLKYLDRKGLMAEREGIEKFLASWRKSWETEDLGRYLSHYHKGLFYDRFRGPYRQFAAYKKRVFQGPGNPKIELSNVTLLIDEDYAKVVAKQHYHSNTIDDVGKKTLYLKKDSFYQWKIVGELWSKLEPRAPFSPSMRFFKSYQVPEGLVVK